MQVGAESGHGWLLLAAAHCTDAVPLMVNPSLHENVAVLKYWLPPDLLTVPLPRALKLVPVHTVAAQQNKVAMHACNNSQTCNISQKEGSLCPCTVWLRSKKCIKRTRSAF